MSNSIERKHLRLQLIKFVKSEKRKAVLQGKKFLGIDKKGNAITEEAKKPYRREEI
jgi:hypothetical protein